MILFMNMNQNSCHLPLVQPQTFSSNLQKPNEHSSSISISGLKHVYEKIKTQITVFLHLDNENDFVKIFSKFLSLFSNFNNVGETPQFNYAIVRNFKQINDFLQSQNEELNQLNIFFRKISFDELKIILITHLKRKVPLRKEIAHENSDIKRENFRSYFLINFLTEIHRDKQNEEKKKKIQTSLIHLFEFYTLISDEPTGDLKFLRSHSEISQILHQEISNVFASILNQDSKSQHQFFLHFQRTIFSQMLSLEKMSEVLASVVVIEVLEILSKGNEISQGEILEILQDYSQMVDPRVKEVIYHDLQTVFMSYVYHFNEIICKILDGETSNCIFLKSVYFHDNLIYPIKLNPVVVGLIFHVFKMKSLKKNNDEYFYSDNNLPKITIILFEGFDSMDNYYLLKNVKNLQIISIFYDNDELRISEEIDEIHQELEKIRTKKHFNSIPLNSRDIDNENFRNPIKSKDILQIFENIVFPLISNYRPSFIIMTYNFAFSKINDNFIMSPNVFSIIINKLGLLSNHKMLLVPVLHSMKENKEFENYELYKSLENNKGVNLPKSLFINYQQFLEYKKQFVYENNEAILNNRLYIYEIMGGFLNVVGGNIKKDYIDLKASYLNSNYLKNSNFFPYLIKLIQTKYKHLPYLKKTFLEGKLGTKIQKKSALIKAEDIELQDTSIKNNLDLKLVESHKENDEQTSKFYTNKISLIHPTEEKFLICQLTLLTNSTKSKFFYSDQTTYCIHYARKKIFFLNNPSTIIPNKNSYENFIADINFESHDLSVTSMPFYLPDQTLCLVDFSLCYSDTHLFLIWGRYKNTSKLNHEIFAYEIDYQRWYTIQLQSVKPIIPRLNASSVCYKLEKHHHIYILGGYANLAQNQFDIYDIVDYIVGVEGVKTAYHQQLDKKHYKENYKSLLDSQLIPLPMNSNDKTPSKFQALMFGGSFSKFLFNQEKKTLSFYQVTFNNDRERSVEFDNFLAKHQTILKKNVEGLNLLFSTQNKNYFFYDWKKIGLAPVFFSKEKKGLFLDFIAPNLNFRPEGVSFQQLGLKEYERKTKLEIFKEKKEKFTQKLKFFYSTILMPDVIKCPIFTPILKIQDQPLYKIMQINSLTKFFETSSLFDFLLIDEDCSELMILSSKEKIKNSIKNEEFSMNRIGFYANELKKVGFNYFEYVPSRLKSSSYALRNEMLYILVNNERDTGCKRVIYSMNLRTLEKESRSRVELILVFEHKSTIFKGSSILCDSKFIYVVGGQIIDMKKFMEFRQIEDEVIEKEYFKGNFYYDISRNVFVKNFASNLNEMMNPYVVSSNDHLFCFDRKIISNPYLELNFLGKINKKVSKALKNVSYQNGNFLYGEFIQKNLIENEDWKCFLVDLDTCELVFLFSNKEKKILKYIKHEKKATSVSLGISFLGQISKKEGAGFLFFFRNENGRLLFKGNKQKKLVFLDFEQILYALYENEGDKMVKPIKWKDLIEEKIHFDENDLLFQVKDCLQSKENEKEMCFITQNLERISFEEEFQKMDDN